MSRRSSRKTVGQKNRAFLNVEALEDRVTPTTSTTAISGFVYYDANNNGVFDSGETPIANNTIQLENSSGAVIGTTTTDATGAYQFTTDQTNLTQPGTQTETVTFPATETDFNLTGALQQFDPSLGKLTSVVIQHTGSITSQIKVENLSTDSPSTITGTVAGTLNLVGPGVNDNLAISASAGSFNAAAYGGTTAFGANGDASGTAFPQKTASNSDTITVTDPTALAAYTGTGTVNLTENATATSNATGGGNLEVNVQSTAQADITVTYNYLAAGPLEPGTYTIVQTAIPAGYTPGKVVGGDGTTYPTNPTAPETIGPITIPVGGGTSTNNDFGELKTTSISGYVYYDANDNGVKDSGEPGIAGVTMTLTGGATPQTATTDANGFFQFSDLVPGAYSLAETTEPPNYLNGTDAAGTNGGSNVAVSDVVGNETMSNIVLSPGAAATDYDFGKLKPASVAGNVYVDANNDGQLDPGDPPIAGDTITLTGFSDQAPVSLTTTTAADGSYSFTNLRPSDPAGYTITQTPPAGYLPGATTVGTQGGSETSGTISDVVLNAGVNGTSNNFGELKPSTPGTPIPPDVVPFGILPGISKAQMTTNPSWANIDPAMLNEMSLAVATTMTLTGHQLDLNDIAAGVQTINSSGASAYVSQVWNSGAHFAAEVNSAYATVLKRAPTSTELDAGVSLLSGGASSTTLLQNLYSSTDFQNLYPTHAAQATALYQGILDETPGTASSASLVQSLGIEQLGTVVQNLFASTAAIENQIDNAYLLVLRRDPTATETSIWVPQLQSGAITIDQLTQQLLASQEFAALAYANVT
jgi:hypothetical protein